MAPRHRRRLGQLADAAVADVSAAYYSSLWARSYVAGVALQLLAMELLQVAGCSIFFVVSRRY